MKAMILAAGRGERMRPLTDACPKPLLPVAGQPLISRHLARLAAAGFCDVVINHAHLGAMLVERLGNGEAFGVRIAWSAEPPGALGTAGGIAQALPLLGDAPFLVINGDVFCDWDVGRARALAVMLERRGDLAHLVMVPNPPHHPEGDFALADGRVREAQAGTAGLLTFSGIGVYAPAMFADVPRGAPSQLATCLRAAMRLMRVGGECHRGEWHDVGTPARLAALEQRLVAREVDAADAAAAPAGRR